MRHTGTLVTSATHIHMKHVTWKIRCACRRHTQQTERERVKKVDLDGKSKHSNIQTRARNEFAKWTDVDAKCIANCIHI